MVLSQCPKCRDRRNPFGLCSSTTRQEAVVVGERRDKPTEGGVLLMSHLQKQPVFSDWQTVINAPHSRFFGGRTSDTVFDRTRNGTVLTPSTEAMFTQSNARVLIGQSANGTFRMIALPTQVYPAPTSTGELGLGPGMYHHFDVAMYAGDLSYRIALDEGSVPIDLDAEGCDNRTVYADHVFPLTRTRARDLEVALVGFAPVAADVAQAPLAPAPLPGLAGAFYVLRLHNTGSTPIKGKIVLQAGDMLVGHYEDAAPDLRDLKRPHVALRQQTLILTRPEGAVGVHLHDGKWTRLKAPFEAERAFRLDPGEEAVFETHLAMGGTYADVMPVIYALHMRAALDWLNLTAGFWRTRLGQLSVDAENASEAAQISRDIYLRCLLDNFNCLQTDAAGNLIAHWQGAPSHGYGTVWGIDVEPTAVSIVHICPELARQAFVFFATRSRAPKAPSDHSVPILVAPIIIARQWLQVTGDVAFLQEHPEVIAVLGGIARDLLALQSAVEPLFPSRFSSDGAVGRRYDYGTNVKAWYALDSMAYLLRHLGRPDEADRYTSIAQDVRGAIGRTMVADGPFGPQISGGTNLGEDPGTFYLLEGVLYYDGEDTSSMLAPVYGLCDFSDTHWVNYHRYARSLWCPNYDPEFGALRWSPGEYGAGALDGTGFFSRLGGTVTPAEMLEALTVLHQVVADDVTGSVFWWPYGLEYKRALTRCSQGQGAWAWQYLQQWLGLKVDAPSRTLTLAPRGLFCRVDWPGFASGENRFDLRWTEGEQGTLYVRNNNPSAWRLEIGYRLPGSGAVGPVAWQTRTLEPGEEVLVASTAPDVRAEISGFDDRTLSRYEAEAFGDGEGIVFRRFGPARLWGHWEADKLWDGPAMPLAIRLLVLNGTEQEWSDVAVELTCPEGWRAQGRQPQHWTRAEHLHAGTVHLELGALPPLSKTVAPFWVKQPTEIALLLGWDIGPEVPFHATSQPSEGLKLYTAGETSTGQVSFHAELRARMADGQEVRRQLSIPVQIVR
jgi:hypothetical protein